MCRRHWYSLPQPTRNRVLVAAARHDRDPTNGPVWQALLTVREQALAEAESLARARGR